MRNHAWVLACLVLCTNFVFSQGKFDNFSGPYLGQKPPGMKPEVFAPAIFSRSQPEWVFDCVFSPGGSELYFTQFDREQKIDQIMVMRKVNNIWSKPVAVSFNCHYSSHNLCISPDGFRIFFKSWRPLPGHNLVEKHSFLWFVHRVPNGWSQPLPVKYDIEYLPAGHPSVCNNGNLYFRYRGKDNTGNADIHLSKFINGTYGAPVNLGQSINTEYVEGDVCVSADEKYLVVACWDRPDNRGECDLYISYKDNTGDWTPLENLGEPINTTNIENNPMISPDGNYLFFMRVNKAGSVPTCDTFWISTAAIKQFKAKGSRGRR